MPDKSHSVLPMGGVAWYRQEPRAQLESRDLQLPTYNYADQIVISWKVLVGYLSLHLETHQYALREN